MASSVTRIAACALACALLAPASALAGRSSLPSGPGPLPGPDILYEKPRKAAPQLRNRGPWKAKPLLVSGASAYKRGEFIYQDFLYDDHGARGTARDPSDPRMGDDTFSGPNGTITYPTDVKAYRNNVADLVELRVRTQRRSTLFRLTFNSMTKPGLVATTIALGDSATPQELPFAAGASAPAERFLVVRGRRAKMFEAGENGQQVRPRSVAAVSKRNRQITVRVPKRAWDPGRQTVRMAAATGLWDKAAKAYAQPGDSASATAPGGAVGLADPSALFNVAFRYDEPLPDIADIPGTLGNTAWWREKAQGAALAGNDISEFFAEVDFGKLRHGVTDRMRGEPGAVPRSGPINRILSSRFSGGQGVDYEVSGCGSTAGCPGQYLGRLQPYSIYVPERKASKSGRGLTLLLHSLGATYNQFHGSNNQSQFGERGEGHIVVTTLSRGPDGWYYGLAGAEVFEVWADVARRYRLDPQRSATAGYSMGGYGSYKLATQFPDLFAAGQPTVGPPGLGVWVPGVVDPAEGSNTNAMLASLRHVPFMLWHGVLDELVPYPGAVEQGETFAELGLRHRFDSFPTADHFALAANDEYGLAADFLGGRKVKRNPAHVSYVRNPSMDFPNLGFKADHAYWLSDVRLRDEEAGGGLGSVEAVSGGFGRGDAPVGPLESSGGTLTGGSFGPFAFTRREIEWGPEPRIAKRDRLELVLRNVDRLRVHARRAKLSCEPQLQVDTDGPVEVKLAGCRSAIIFD